MRQLFAVCVFVALVLPVLPMACTRQQARAVSDVVRDIALEVCVEGDTVTACLKKCSEADERK